MLAKQGKFENLKSFAAFLIKMPFSGRECRLEKQLMTFGNFSYFHLFW